MDMERRIPLPIFIIVIIQCIVLLGHAFYFGFIGWNWGFNERFINYIVNDSFFLILIMVALVGLLLHKTWSWWMSTIIFAMLFLSNFISLIGLFIAQLDMTGYSFSIASMFYDILILFSFFIGLVLLFLPYIRKKYSVSISTGQTIFFVGVGAIILYMLYFILMIII
ncbi:MULTISPECIES: hypothetical protein [Bacillaceae]|uniref:Uncharacterized protein n=1 Tax=Evansella alkalicola TaxID=745819 RepID=A0ABS6JND8_9BACI|nr:MULTISPECIES: hypothetical protein [Bacillaceae]MBU9720068.1 hypothetical protein [Bacillus alkalicola]